MCVNCDLTPAVVPTGFEKLRAGSKDVRALLIKLQTFEISEYGWFAGPLAASALD